MVSDQSFHTLCAEREGLLLGSVDNLPGIAFLDRAEDELFRVTQETTGSTAPREAPWGWGISAHAARVAAAMALRTGRAISLMVSNGYGVEAAGLVRRLGEIAQHAIGCAQDPSATYARNWGEGAGKAGKPSSAYVRGTADPNATREKYGFLSSMGHADLVPYLNFMSATDERGEIVHPVQPARHPAADAICLASAACDLVRTALAVCQAHGLDTARTMALAQELHVFSAAADRDADAWALAREKAMQPAG